MSLKGNLKISSGEILAIAILKILEKWTVMTIQLTEDMTLLNMKKMEPTHSEAVVKLYKIHQLMVVKEEVSKTPLLGEEEIEGGHPLCRVNQSSNSKTTIGMLNQIIQP